MATGEGGNPNNLVVNKSALNKEETELHISNAKKELADLKVKLPRLKRQHELCTSEKRVEFQPQKHQRDQNRKTYEFLRQKAMEDKREAERVFEQAKRVFQEAKRQFQSRSQVVQITLNEGKGVLQQGESAFNVKQLSLNKNIEISKQILEEHEYLIKQKELDITIMENQVLINNGMYCNRRPIANDL